MRSQNSVQTPRITHACKLVGPQDGRSEAASSPPGNHISNSNEAELQMVLVRRTPSRIDHRNRANGESEIYAIVAAREKRPRSLPTHLILPPMQSSTCYFTNPRISQPNNLNDNPHLPEHFLLLYFIISNLLQHRHLRVRPRRRTSTVVKRTVISFQM